MHGIQRSHPLREVDLLRVKGKVEPVRVYEIVTHKLERHPQLSDSFAAYEEGLTSYRRGDWSRALKKVQQCHSSGKNRSTLSTLCQALPIFSTESTSS